MEWVGWRYCSTPHGTQYSPQDGPQRQQYQESPSSEKHVLKSGFHVMGFDQCFQINLVFVICLWVQVSRVD